MGSGSFPSDAESGWAVTCQVGLTPSLVEFRCPEFLPIDLVSRSVLQLIHSRLDLCSTVLLSLRAMHRQLRRISIQRRPTCSFSEIRLRHWLHLEIRRVAK